MLDVILVVDENRITAFGHRLSAIGPQGLPSFRNWHVRHDVHDLLLKRDRHGNSIR